MSLERYFELYEWKYEKIVPIIKNLRKQRNKIYAHNDKKTIEGVILDYSLSISNIETLISFSLEFCQFIVTLLTGVKQADKPVNIDDWEGTLILAQLGNKYKDVELLKMNRN